MTIKELREQTGLSQSQFAARYRFTTRQIQSWEQGWRETPQCILYLLERCVNQDFNIGNNPCESEVVI